jgi:hypothetical protein
VAEVAAVVQLAAQEVEEVVVVVVAVARPVAQVVVVVEAESLQVAAEEAAAVVMAQEAAVEAAVVVMAQEAAEVVVEVEVMKHQLNHLLLAFDAVYPAMLADGSKERQPHGVLV